jgi:hypothetical protein
MVFTTKDKGMILGMEEVTLLLICMALLLLCHHLP